MENKISSDVVTYRQNWDYCMHCALLRQSMAKYEKNIRDARVLNGISLIRARCTDDYKMKKWSCPEICIMKMYETAAGLMPTSPLYTLYQDISAYITSYSNKEKPQALGCFANVNSLYLASYLPNWVPSIAPVDNFLGGGSLVMAPEDVDLYYNALVSDPVSRLEAFKFTKYESLVLENVFFEIDESLLYLTFFESSGGLVSTLYFDIERHRHIELQMLLEHMPGDETNEGLATLHQHPVHVNRSRRPSLPSKLDRLHGLLRLKAVHRHIYNHNTRSKSAEWAE